MQDKIKGFINYISYLNEETGWTVFDLELENGTKVNANVVQKNNLDVGSYVQLEGVWKNHKKYGKQFNAKNFQLKTPSDHETFVKFLEKGNISGIGIKIAGRLDDKYGKNLLNIFQNNIDKIVEIKGISDNLLDKIKKDWYEYEQKSEAMIFFKKYGLSKKTIDEILLFYNYKALEEMKKNPYAIIDLSDKVNFLEIDKFALRIGGGAESLSRIINAIAYILKKELSNGHTFLYKQELVVELKKLNIKDLETVKESLEIYSEFDIITTYEDKIALSRVYKVEQGIITNIDRILKNEDQSFFIDDVEERLKAESLTHSIQLSDEQYQAVLNIPRNKISILTGGAGVGKTTTVSMIMKMLKSLSFNILLAAPTGSAAQRMEDVTNMPTSTIHRLLDWNPVENRFNFNRSNKLDADFIIIDEFSMVDLFLLNSLLEAVNNKTQLLFIGDPNQLPSVQAGDCLNLLIKHNIVPIYRLTKIFRQDENAKIVKYSYMINEKEIPPIDNLLKEPKNIKNKDCFFIETDYFSNQEYQKALELRKGRKLKDEFTYYNNNEDIKQSLNYKEREGFVNLNEITNHHSIFYKKDPLDMLLEMYFNIIPSKYPNKEIQILSPIKKSPMGVININKKIQEKINPKKSPDQIEINVDKYVLRKGDKVIQTKNNYNLNFFNGDIGYIKEVYDKKTILIETTNGKKINLTKLEEIIELELAYAITIHKSQGCEFDVVICPISWMVNNMLNKNLLYTAITRGKEFFVFLGNFKAFQYGVRNISNIKRKSNLDLLLENYKKSTKIES